LSHFHLSVQISKFEVEEPTGETSKAQVGAESCGACQQGVGVHTWTLKVCHPCLQKNGSLALTKIISLIAEQKIPNEGIRAEAQKN